MCRCNFCRWTRLHKSAELPQEAFGQKVIPLWLCPALPRKIKSDGKYSAGRGGARILSPDRSLTRTLFLDENQGEGYVSRGELYGIAVVRASVPFAVLHFPDRWPCRNIPYIN